MRYRVRTPLVQPPIQTPRPYGRIRSRRIETTPMQMFIGPPPKRRGRAPSYLRDDWSDLEWENHPAAQRCVSEHPAGMTLEEIGTAMGITRERVRQIEHSAIAKLSQNAGGDIALVRGFTIPISECRCGENFVRGRGRQQMCDVCEKKRKKRRIPPHVLAQYGHMIAAY